MGVEQTIINPDPAVLDQNKTKIRQEEMLFGNLKLRLIGELRKSGAIKVSVEGFEKKENEITAKAKFDLRGYKESTFTFRPNHMGNFIIKGLELSLDNATPVKSDIKIENFVEEKFILDLALVQAKQVDSDQFEIIYPTIGVTGILSKENIDAASIKTLLSQATEFYCLKPEFVNELNVNFTKSEDLPNIESKDTWFEMQKGLQAFAKSNNEEKERNRSASLRENLIRSIEMKAQETVRKMGMSYSKGTPKILSSEVSLQVVDNKFDGSVFVKAKISDDVVTYNIPVVKNNVIVKGDLDTYKLANVEQYNNTLEKKLNEDIKNSLKQDIELIKAQDEAEQKILGEKLTATKVSDMQKVILTDKNWLPEGIEDGQILNLKGNIYKVEFEGNGIMCRLVLQQA